MASLQEAMQEYQRHLQKGIIQQAYRGLMDYFGKLRAHFTREHPEFGVSGSIYFGYMDMTYLPLFPEALKKRNLKIAIVFLHEAFRFEAWLSGGNRDVQEEYWKLIRERGWDEYSLSENPRTADSILEKILVKEPDFDDLDALTSQIVEETMGFLRDVEAFFLQHPLQEK